MNKPCNFVLAIKFLFQHIIFIFSKTIENTVFFNVHFKRYLSMNKSFPFFSLLFATTVVFGQDPVASSGLNLVSNANSVVESNAGARHQAVLTLKKALNETVFRLTV